MSRPLLSWLAWLLGAAAALAQAAPAAQPPAQSAAQSAARTVLIVSGAEGDPAYAEGFAREVSLWEAACDRGGARRITLGSTNAPPPGEPESDHDRLRKLLAAEDPDAPGELWIVLIGHGTFDGREARFNLRGPDLTATELADWLRPFRRPLAILVTSSASAPFIAALSAPNRVIVTATRSGAEMNFTRFGRHLAEALGDPASDLDGDGQVSLLEAFLTAARRTAEFYKNDNRLATEHALLDDNGDKLGTPADWFRGLRAVKVAEGGAKPDGARASQFHLIPSAQEANLPPEIRTRRDALELEISRLRDEKATLPEADYYGKLEPLLLDLARLYETNGPSASTSKAPAPR